MLFSEVLGLPHIKNHLTTTADKGRIPHAQLFVGPTGSGTLPMAIAYAQYILCSNSGGENNSGNAACNLKMDHLSHPDNKAGISSGFPFQWQQWFRSRK